MLFDIKVVTHRRQLTMCDTLVYEFASSGCLSVLMEKNQ